MQRRQFPYQTLRRNEENGSAAERSLYIDNKIRAATNLPPKGPIIRASLDATEPRDGYKGHRGGAGWLTKLTTKRAYEPKPRTSAS
jgi:hypothetical protein